MISVCHLKKKLGNTKEDYLKARFVDLLDFAPVTLQEIADGLCGSVCDTAHPIGGDVPSLDGGIFGLTEL